MKYDKSYLRNKFLLKRKKGVENPTMKAKNIVQLKKTNNKKKR